MDSWAIIVLILAPLTGGAVALYLKPSTEGLYKPALSFSGAYLFGIAILHFFPVIFSGESHTPGINIGIFVLLGYFLQLILEQLTKGIEHGHFHAHGHSPSFAYSVMLGICIHGFFDGVPVFSDEHVRHEHSMLWAISAHKIPEGFALATLLLMINTRKSMVALLLVLFSLTAPAGTLFAGYLSGISPSYLQILFALVAGLILHVSTTILFESETGTHYFSAKKIAAVVAGALLAILTG